MKCYIPKEAVELLQDDSLLYKDANRLRKNSRIESQALTDPSIFQVKDFGWYQVQKLLKLFQEHSSSSYRNHHQDFAEADNEPRPSPSLVPVPFMMSHVVSNLIKTKLPVVEFSRSKLQGVGEESAVCAICLECVKGSEEITELDNCSHLYHRECIDGWVDQGHRRCPLCRLKLLPCQVDDDEDAKGEKDPWRLERIAYLFGED